MSIFLENDVLYLKLDLKPLKLKLKLIYED